MVSSKNRTQQLQRIDQLLFGPAAAVGLGLLFTVVYSTAHADVRDCEAVSRGFATVVEFDAPSETGKPNHIDGVLWVPEGARNLPALVALHGWGGLYSPRCYEPEISGIASWGYVTLLVDSNSHKDRSGLPTHEYSTSIQAQHALAATTFLASLPQVDHDRIGLIGWSHGGLATIKAVADPELSASWGLHIRAAAAIYPICPTTIEQLDVPLILLIGAKDETVSVSACRELSLNDPTGHIDFVAYPDAAHTYDLSWTPNYRRKDAADSFARIQRHFEDYLASQ